MYSTILLPRVMSSAILESITTRDGYQNPVFNRSRGYILKDRSIDKLWR